MKVGVIAPNDGAKSATKRIKRAETLGYDIALLGELWGRNSFVQLAEAAVQTTDIRLGTAIVNVFSRSPAVLAMGAYSLQQISDGRTILGLGTSTPKAVEDLHSMDFERPVRRTHETVELLKKFLGEEESVQYEGKVFSTDGFPSLSTDLQIYNAALGPANRRVTGRLCDGWMPNNIPYSNLESAFETIAETADDSGRDPDSITIAPWVHTAVSDDAEEAINAVRGAVAYYVGSSDGYKNAVGAVYDSEADKIAQAWRNNDRDAARKLVTDEMVKDLGCAGTPSMARDQLQELAKREFIDFPIVHIPQTLDCTLIDQTLDAVSPAQY
jgi:alkanesulfonate monooxygenase SsuD/methylene tetrahydromethanopterin reductase-like flavin-dependent oxidoreductase (luciferase family)